MSDFQEHVRESLRLEEARIEALEGFWIPILVSGAVALCGAALFAGGAWLAGYRGADIAGWTALMCLVTAATNFFPPPRQERVTRICCLWFAGIGALCAILWGLL